MKKYQVIRIREHKHLIERAAKWFHPKWGIPEQAYLESMIESVQGDKAVPQWYVVLDEGEIIAGIGVIENDFHDRKDLTPNVCAVYVDAEHRKNGIAAMMLDYVCEDLKVMGVDTLYLVTGHDALYEKFGWEFLCMVQGDGDTELSRMYIRRS